jgi:hypothetical protein
MKKKIKAVKPMSVEDAIDSSIFEIKILVDNLERSILDDEDPHDIKRTYNEVARELTSLLHLLQAQYPNI